MKEIIIVTLIMLLLFGLLVVGVFKLSEIECNAQTQDMGFQHRWSLVSGCMIEVNPGQWIPLDNYYFKQE